MADANMKYVLEVSAVAGVGGTQAIDQQTAALKASQAAQEEHARSMAKVRAEMDAMVAGSRQRIEEHARKLAEGRQNEEEFTAALMREAEAMAKVAAAEQSRQRAIDAATSRARKATIGTSVTPEQDMANALAEAKRLLSNDAGQAADDLKQRVQGARQSVFDLGDAFKALSGGSVTELVTRLGMVGTAVWGAHKALKAVVDADPELSKALDNMKGAFSQFVADGINGSINAGGDFKRIVDQITIALGGETEEMKRHHEALREHVKLSGQAQTATEKFTKALKDQKEALTQLDDELETSKKERELRTQQQRDLQDDAAKAERRSIETDDSLTPEQRAAALKGLDQRDAQTKIDRSREDADTQLGDAKDARDRKALDLAGKQKMLEEQQQRVAAGERLARALQTKQDYEFRKQSNPDFFNNVDPTKALRNEMNMDAEVKAARENAAKIIGSTPYNDPKAEKAALDQLKAEVQAAVREMRAAEEKLKRAQLDQEGAAWKNDRAQRDLNEAAQAQDGQTAEPAAPAATPAPAPAPAEPSNASSPAESASPSRERRASPVNQTDLDPNVMGYDENGPVYANSPGPDADNKGSGGVDWDYVAELRQRIADGEQLNDDEQAYLDAAFEYYQQRIDAEKEQRKHKRRSSSGGPSRRGRMHGGGGGGGSSGTSGNVSAGAAFSGANRPGADGRMGAVSPSTIFTGNDPRVKTMMVGTSPTEEGENTGAFNPSAAAPWMLSMADNHATLADAMTRIIRSMTEHTRAVTNAATPMHEVVRDSVMKHQDLGQKLAMVGTKLRENRLDERL